MPQIGWFELLLIVIIAILVIGPKDFPIVLKKVGTWIGSIKRYFSDIQNEVNKATEIDSLNIKDTKENSKEKDD
jgi:sec-independent protein translocase protein TatB|tara:strand:+ start:254 stop:475 length:222 start_codon:yes stop_codon:yes gene_type:complete